MLAEIPLHGRFERLTEELMRNRLSSAMIWTLAGLAALGSLLCGESLPAGQELKVPSFAYEKFKLALKVIVHEDHRLETSPGNYQAWVAIPAGQSNQDFARRLRKGTGADETASGATRVAGSLNFQEKYAPDLPAVQITHSAPA
jgi:RepB DNA-primase from phage plasmid